MISPSSQTSYLQSHPLRLYVKFYIRQRNAFERVRLRLGQIFVFYIQHKKLKWGRSMLNCGGGRHQDEPWRQILMTRRFMLLPGADVFHDPLRKPNWQGCLPGQVPADTATVVMRRLLSTCIGISASSPTIDTLAGSAINIRSGKKVVSISYPGEAFC